MLFALDHHVERLADDHARARRAAEAFAQAAPGALDPRTVETNIVMLDAVTAGWAPTDLSGRLAEVGVRAYAAGPAHVRFVWHLDVDDDATAYAIEATTALLRSGP